MHQFISKTHSKNSQTLRDLSKLNEENQEALQQLFPYKPELQQNSKVIQSHDLESNDYKYSDNNSLDLGFSYKEDFHKEMEDMKRNFVSKMTPNQTGRLSKHTHFLKKTESEKPIESVQNQPGLGNASEILSTPFTVNSIKKENLKMSRDVQQRKQLQMEMLDNFSGFDRKLVEFEEEQVKSQIHQKIDDWEEAIHKQKKSKSFQMENEKSTGILKPSNHFAISKDFMSFRKKSAAQSGLGQSIEQKINKKAIKRTDQNPIDFIQEEDEPMLSSKKINFHSKYMSQQHPSKASIYLEKEKNKYESQNPIMINSKIKSIKIQNESLEKNEFESIKDKLMMEGYQQYEQSLNSFIESKQVNPGQEKKEKSRLEIMEVNSSFEMSQRKGGGNKNKEGMEFDLLTQSVLVDKKDEFEAFLSNLNSEESSHYDSKSFNSRLKEKKRK